MKSITIALTTIRIEHLRRFSRDMTHMELGNDVKKDESVSDEELAKAAPPALQEWPPILKGINDLETLRTRAKKHEDFDKLAELVGPEYWPRYL